MNRQHPSPGRPDPIRLGDAVPPLALVDGAGDPWDTAWTGAPTLLIFHRHLACLLCQQHVLEVRDQLGEFGDARIIVVTFADPGRLDAHRAHLDVPFPILTDLTLAIYDAFGFRRGTRRAIWNVDTLRFYGGVLRHGRRLTRPTEDIYRLGGDVVIDAAGRLTFRYASAHPDDRPAIPELVDAIRRAR